MSGRILIHVQHLLGTGHLRRAAALARGLAAGGAEVELVSGGAPIAGLDCGAARLVQLPATRADDSFRTLLDAAGRPVDGAWKARRRAALLERLGSFRPAALVTELFPFGRRALDFELVPLIEAARAMRPRPLLLCSLRDVLVAPAPARKIELALARARDWYDRVLVHGDPALIPIEASFPGIEAIFDRVVYTGYVDAPPSPSPPPPAGEGEDEVIVSAGGGAVGARLFEAAIAAGSLSQARRRRWRVLAGEHLPAGALAGLATARPGLTVEPARADFRGLLARCAVSVSQAGYNTVMDVLTTRARAVLVPFEGGRENEQTLRAAALAARGWAQVIPESELTPERLAQAVDTAAASPRPVASALAQEGAAKTARLIAGWLAGRMHAGSP